MDLRNRTARRTLGLRNRPYWQSQGPGTSLGYRKVHKGQPGTWYVRYTADNGKQIEKSLRCVADDLEPANATTVLNALQAADVARDWRSRGTTNRAEITVADAVRRYLELKGAKRSFADMRSTMNKHVLPELGRVKLKDLNLPMVQAWLYSIAGPPVNLRTRTEEQRKRQATANKILRQFNAVLSQAVRLYRQQSQAACRPPYTGVPSEAVPRFTGRCGDGLAVHL